MFMDELEAADVRITSLNRLPQHRRGAMLSAQIGEQLDEAQDQSMFYMGSTAVYMPSPRAKRHSRFYPET